MKTGVLLCSAFGLAAVPEAASAYECTPAHTEPICVGQAWTRRSIDYALHMGSALLEGEARRALVARTFAAWSGAAHSCTDLTFVDRGYTAVDQGFDSTNLAANTNVVTSADTQAQASLFGGSETLAITITSFATETGELVDADIILNATDPAMPLGEVASAASCEMIQPPLFDLESTLAHEVGHFVGFDHGTDPESTMYASSPPCETKKRDLTEDDVRGLCDIYPAGMALQVCHRCNVPQKGRGGCGCSAAHGGSPFAPLLFALVLAFGRGADPIRPRARRGPRRDRRAS
jgi:matrixin